MTPGSADILGHRATYTRLRAALVGDVAHHAWLFVGPQGVGKRLVANRLSQAANCERAAELRPCGVCPTCRSIAAGSFPDIVIVAPEAGKKTATIGVDAVREVVRKVGYHRYLGRRRIVVIDPVDGLTIPAANALLKTLEEPPAGTGFILISHQPNTLLPTILSRCQRTTFAAVPEDEVAGWLSGRGVPDAAVIARLALGCPGVALSLAGGAAERRREQRQSVLAVLRSGDLGQVFEVSRSLAEGARDGGRDELFGVLDVMEELLRDAVVLGSGAAVGLLEEREAQTARGMADLLGPSGVARCADALRSARADLDAHVSTRLVLDALFVRLSTELGTLRST